jgi:hypothetical protein
MGGPDTWGADLDTDELAARISEVEAAETKAAKGAALEQFVAWLICHLPGIEVRAKNQFSYGRGSEIDLTAWNHQHDAGFRSLPNVILVECKNLTKPVRAAQIAWFDWKMRLGGVRYGLLVAANGVTGKPVQRNAAYQIVQHARGDGRTILIVDLSELRLLTSTHSLRELLIDKICDVTAGATQTAPDQ